MFDFVTYEMECPVCGKTVSGFQSKDGNRMLDILKPKDVINFYTSCRWCGTWIEFNRKLKTEVNVKRDFNMTIRKRDIEKDEVINIKPDVNKIKKKDKEQFLKDMRALSKFVGGDVTVVGLDGNKKQIIKRKR